MSGAVLHSIDLALEALPTRIALTLAVALSVWPEPPTAVTVALGVLFGVELVARGVTLVHAARSGLPVAARVLVFWVSAAAFVSFLPVEWTAFAGARVARLALLLVYWSPLGAGFARVALRRERLQQLGLVAGLALLLTITGTAFRFALEGKDAGHVKDVFWWAFRQVESADNLVQQLDNPAEVFVSLCLTGGGLLLMAVLIGLGTGLVEELVREARTGRLTASHHLVILNFDARGLGVLQNALHYARNQLGRRRYAVQGAEADRPDVLDTPELRAVDYRMGSPTHRETLLTLGVDRVRRVAVLATGETAESDAQAVTAAMAVRRMRPDAWLVVELARPTNARAALEACGARTIPVPARRLAALALAQELADPGRARLILDIVSLTGQELYSCVLGDGRFAQLPDTLAPRASAAALRDHLLVHHRALLLGTFDDVAARPGELLPRLNPDGTAPVPPSRGIIAIADRFGAVEAGVRSLFGDIAEPPPAEALQLDPVAPWLPARVLVLGFNPDTVETVGELLRLFPGAEVTVVGPDEATRDVVKSAFVGERTETGAVFEVAGPKRLELRGPAGETVGVVHARVADRLSDALFYPQEDRASPVGTVFDYDALLMLSERHAGAADPDAASVLGMLKLLESRRTARGVLRRVVVELTDEDKRDHLAERCHGRREDDGLSVALVCTTELRNDILTHAFFVPGLPAVLHDLLTAGGHEVRGFTPRDRTGELTVRELVHALAVRQPPMVPMAIAFEDGRTLVNPAPDLALHLGQIRVIYCLIG